MFFVCLIVCLFFNCFAAIELSCVIESISTTNPRIEWKKITNEGPSYVYFDNKISGSLNKQNVHLSLIDFYHFGGLFPVTTPCCVPTGDLENRAEIREPATLFIRNATRSDTAKYRCEVTAIDDHKSFDEIVIDLVVRGTTSPPLVSNQHATWADV